MAMRRLKCQMTAEEIAASIIRNADKDTSLIGGNPASNPGFLAERVARNRVDPMEVALLVDQHVQETLAPNDPDAQRDFRSGLKEDQVDFLERKDRQKAEEEEESGY